MDEGRTTAVVVSSIGGAPPKRQCLIGPVRTWASLPLDLLLEVFRRLESTAVIRCAAACRPWRRAIIGNASFLRPRPDRFLPNLLLGVFHGYGYSFDNVRLRRTVGPLQSAVPLNVAAGCREAAQYFIPAAAAAAAGKYQQSYGELLSSRDGFILLEGNGFSSDDLCLCNPMTGDCAFVDGFIRCCTYILLTGYDDMAVRILAVYGWDRIRTKDNENRFKYQLFSFRSDSGGGTGVWGPVRLSMEQQQGLWVLARHHTTVVRRDVVHWLGGPSPTDYMTWTVALDVHTGRTWITELPEKIHFDCASSTTILATTGDGRLSLIRQRPVGQIQIWVLNDGDRWSIQHRVDVQKLLLHCRDVAVAHTLHLNAFCPRSGCVLASVDDQEIRIDLESGPCPHVECIGKSEAGPCKPYEMDWSTYISKMKHF